MLNFNSIKVRLELSYYPEFVHSLPFQFHKGTIRTRSAFALDKLYRYFNSIKVRLELGNGSSKIKFTAFQFHKGTIRTLLLMVLRLVSLNFNSIKVRLELFPQFVGVNSLSFQFHKGTIRTHWSYDKKAHTYSGFASAKIQKNLQKNVDA